MIFHRRLFKERLTTLRTLSARDESSERFGNLSCKLCTLYTAESTVNGRRALLVNPELFPN